MSVVGCENVNGLQHRTAASARIPMAILPKFVMEWSDWWPIDVFLKLRYRIVEVSGNPPIALESIQKSDIAMYSQEYIEEVLAIFYGIDIAKDDYDKHEEGNGVF